MTSTSYSRAGRNLKSLLDQVCCDHEPMVITRRSGEDVLVLSEEDFASLEETAYLLRAPANARRLLEAVARNRTGEPGRSLDEVLTQSDLGGEEPDEDRAR